MTMVPPGRPGAVARVEAAVSVLLDPVLVAVRAAVIALAASIVVITFVQVVLRYVFNSSFFGSEELSRFLFAWLIFMGATLALDQGLHFGVDVLVGRLPSALQRVFFAVGQGVVLTVLSILLVKGIQLTALNWRQLSPSLQIPVTFPYAAVPTAAVLMILVTLRRFCRGIASSAPFASAPTASE